MRWWPGHICFIAVLVISACSESATSRRAAKTTDSLSGALSSLVAGLEKTDTALLQKAIMRFNNYRLFIQQNINDTIQKTEADHLLHFYAGGQSLEAFSVNRKTVLQRARLINSQLAKLSEELKNGSEGAGIALLVSREKEEASKLMEAGQDQQKKFQIAFEEFKHSLNGVEMLIRSRNRGELPRIVKDTLDL